MDSPQDQQYAPIQIDNPVDNNLEINHESLLKPQDPKKADCHTQSITVGVPLEIDGNGQTNPLKQFEEEEAYNTANKTYN